MRLSDWDAEMKGREGVLSNAGDIPEGGITERLKERKPKNVLMTWGGLGTKEVKREKKNKNIGITLHGRHRRQDAPKQGWRSRSKQT